MTDDADDRWSGHPLGVATVGVTFTAMHNGGWAASRLWADSEVRRCWRSLVVLGILVGLTAALAMAAFAGARRTHTALPRLEAATNAADAIVFASQVGVYQPDWSKLTERDEVVDIAVWDLLFGLMDGEPSGPLFASDDGAWGDRLTRPVITEGRMWNPAATDEVIVSPSVADSLPVGSTFTFQPFAADQGDADFEPRGPVVTFRVVGVGTTVNYFLFASDVISVSPGFAAEYGDQVALLENAEVRLRNGSADIAALRRDVNDLVAPGAPVLDLDEVSRRVDTSLRVEHVALLLLAAIVAIAGGLIAAQALGRSSSTIGRDALALRTLGMTRPSMIAAAVSSHLVVAAVAAVIGPGGAVAVSRWFPVGLGRQIDPTVGTHGDLTVIVPGTFVVILFVLATTAVSASRAIRSDDRPLGRPSALASVIRRTTPVTIGVGAALALDRGTGRGRVAVRPAMVGAAIGVIGVVGTLTIEHSVDDALAHPERAGVTWDAIVYPQVADYGPSELDPEILTAVAEAAPENSGITEVARLVDQVDGIGVPTFMTLPFGAGPAPTFTVIHGRSPSRIGEAAIGPKTARDLGVAVGDSISIGAAQTPVQIVGEALFPNDVHAEFDEGILVSPDQLSAIAPVVGPDDRGTGPERSIVVAFPEGVDAESAIADMSQRLGDRVQFVDPAEIPAELTNLRNVHALPLVLAAFLTLLAVAAVSHVLVTTARLRRRELAVLRALGLTRRSSRVAFNGQATVITLIALAVGIPLGIVVGRSGWRLLAERVPLENVGPVPVLAVASVVPISLLLLNALAIWPGRTAARLRPAETLREE